MRYSAEVVELVLTTETASLRPRSLEVLSDELGDYIVNFGETVCEVLPTPFLAEQSVEGSGVLARVSNVAVIADHIDLIEEGFFEIVVLAQEALADSVLVKISVAEGLEVLMTPSEGAFAVSSGSDSEQWILVPHGTMFEVEVSTVVEESGSKSFQKIDIDSVDAEISYFVFGSCDGELYQAVPMASEKVSITED